MEMNESVNFGIFSLAFVAQINVQNWVKKT